MCNSSRCLNHEFPVVVVTNFHKLGGLKQENHILSQFLKLEVWNSGVSRAAFHPKALKKIASVFPPTSGGGSVAQSCPTLCDPMDCSTPGFPVLYHLLEFVQTHVRWVNDAIQPSHPLSSPSPLALSFPASGSFQTSQFFASDGQSIGVSASASALSMNSQDRFPSGKTG